MAERNAAQAEAKLWLRRYLAIQTEHKATQKSLAEWQKAYDELLRDFRRLELRFGNLCNDEENMRWMLDHLDPYLPDWLQDPKKREARPEMYVDGIRDAA